MFKKKNIISVIVIIMALLFASTSFAQILDMEPEGGYGWSKDYGAVATVKWNGTAADSGDWAHWYYFDIPEGAYPDSMQLLIYAFSSDGNIDLDLTATGCMRLGEKGITRDSTHYKKVATSQTVKTTHITEGVTAYDIVFAAGDTTLNGTDVNRVWFDAVRIGVSSGGDNNQSDTVYRVKMKATTREDD